MMMQRCVKIANQGGKVKIPHEITFIEEFYKKKLSLPQGILTTSL